MFDKSKPEADTNRSLGGFLAVLAIISLVLAVVCLVLGMWDFYSAARVGDPFNMLVGRELVYHPLWIMPLLSLLFLMFGAGCLRIGRWVRQLPSAPPPASPEKPASKSEPAEKD